MTRPDSAHRGSNICLCALIENSPPYRNPKARPRGSPLRASSDHRFIVGALRARGSMETCLALFSSLMAS
jgi:hypothetical protein